MGGLNAWFPAPCPTLPTDGGPVRGFPHREAAAAAPRGAGGRQSEHLLLPPAGPLPAPQPQIARPRPPGGGAADIYSPPQEGQDGSAHTSPPPRTQPPPPGCSQPAPRPPPPGCSVPPPSPSVPPPPGPGGAETGPPRGPRVNNKLGKWRGGSWVFWGGLDTCIRCVALGGGGVLDTWVLWGPQGSAWHWGGDVNTGWHQAWRDAGTLISARGGLTGHGEGEGGSPDAGVPSVVVVGVCSGGGWGPDVWVPGGMMGLQQPGSSILWGLRGIGPPLPHTGLAPCPTSRCDLSLRPCCWHEAAGPEPGQPGGGPRRLGHQPPPTLTLPQFPPPGRGWAQDLPNQSGRSPGGYRGRTQTSGLPPPTSSRGPRHVCPPPAPGQGQPQDGI